jgi:hypothetical protein
VFNIGGSAELSVFIGNDTLLPSLKSKYDAAWSKLKSFSPYDTLAFQILLSTQPKL